MSINGGLEIFGKVSNEAWVLPVLQEITLDSGKALTTKETLQAFRLSSQYISLKQKLYFAFEDQEEAILCIF